MNALKYVLLLCCMWAVYASATVPPRDLTQSAGFEQKLGSQLPMTSLFVDASGRKASLGDWMAARPTLLMLGYFRCPNLCDVTEQGLAHAIAKSGLKPADGVSVLFVSIDVVAGQVVEPLLYGHSSGLSPLAVVVAAIFWSWLWGPIGLVLSTPLTLCLVTLGRYAERLKFLTVLLGDQPALTPAQNFYQRLLADDPHEAIVQADKFLREMALTRYYDERRARRLAART